MEPKVIDEFYIILMKMVLFSLWTCLKALNKIGDTSD